MTSKIESSSMQKCTTFGGMFLWATSFGNHLQINSQCNGSAHEGLYEWLVSEQFIKAINGKLKSYMYQSN